MPKLSKKAKVGAMLFLQNLRAGLLDFDHNLVESIKDTTKEKDRAPMVSASIVIRGMAKAIDEATRATRRGIHL